jgi:hypothetical protein
VDEYVLAAAVRRDEAKAFGCVEELYDTCVGSHVGCFLAMQMGSARAICLDDVKSFNVVGLEPVCARGKPQRVWIRTSQMCSSH